MILLRIIQNVLICRDTTVSCKQIVLDYLTTLFAYYAYLWSVRSFTTVGEFGRIVEEAVVEYFSVVCWRLSEDEQKYERLRSRRLVYREVLKLRTS